MRFIAIIVSDFQTHISTFNDNVYQLINNSNLYIFIYIILLLKIFIFLNFFFDLENLDVVDIPSDLLNEWEKDSFEVLFKKNNFLESKSPSGIIFIYI